MLLMHMYLIDLETKKVNAVWFGLVANADEAVKQSVADWQSQNVFPTDPEQAKGKRFHIQALVIANITLPGEVTIAKPGDLAAFTNPASLPTVARP